MKNAGVLGETLGDKGYVRERTHPSVSDLNYLILSDIFILLKNFSTTVSGDVFDYGSGGAPYRQLFSHCKRYIAADINPGVAVDRVLETNGMTQESDASYDVVLSTQVLEHVADPAAYLRECHRILRPGGELILTTHGMFEEHGCPYDFYRWTSRGLEELVGNCQFSVTESGKFTTEIRAFVQLLNQMMPHLRCAENSFVHFLLALVRKPYFAVVMPTLNYFAGRFTTQSIVAGTDPASLYAGVYVRAKKVGKT